MRKFLFNKFFLRSWKMKKKSARTRPNTSNVYVELRKENRQFAKRHRRNIFEHTSWFIFGSFLIQLRDMFGSCGAFSIECIPSYTLYIQYLSHETNSSLEIAFFDFLLFSKFLVCDCVVFSIENRGRNIYKWT